MFRNELLRKIRRAASYEDALERLGSNVRFIEPKNSAQLNAERKAKLAAILGPKAPKPANAKENRTAQAEPQAVRARKRAKGSPMHGWKKRTRRG